MRRRRLFSLMLITALVAPPLLCADEAEHAPASTPYLTQLRPFLVQHCVDCHGGDEPVGGFTFDRYEDSAHIQTDFEFWEKVYRVLHEGSMPPADVPQPSEATMLSALAAIQQELAAYDCGVDPHPGRVTLRRLNRTEYNNTIRDLIGIEFRPADDFPSDDVGEGFDNIGDVLSLPPILFEKYLAAAETVVEKAHAEGRPPLAQVKADTPEEGIAIYSRNLREFMARAFRRPVTDEELQRVLAIAELAFEEGVAEDDHLKIPMHAVLVSPHFLFRVERDPDPDDEDGVRALDDYELASRLSYFLWSSMPDQELFDLAAAGKLKDPETLKAQAARMLADPRSRALIDNFAGQWLQLRDLAHLQPDADLFPGFDDDLRAAMRRETELLFECVIHEDRSVLDLLSADFTYVNSRLANHYGVTGVTGDEFQRVDLPSQRRGLLTHASILLLTSNPTRTSPVKRGKWILENILGEPPPPPPPGVPELEESGQLLGSLRERMEEHRRNESCAVCHRRMDALGFGLENFDAIGAWREQDGRFSIDPSGTLPGGVNFRSPNELVQILVEQKQAEFVRCLTRKLLVYALGRGLSSQDRCSLDTIEEQLAAGGFRFHALIDAIVTSDPFVLRESQKGR
ncbi:MAG: DUF1592 domain-containing protein [Planctomycetaceae bacterium]|nr:DUF1592 domain-containing protein [Planctomycetaceae bacterium]